MKKEYNLLLIIFLLFIVYLLVPSSIKNTNKEEINEKLYEIEEVMNGSKTNNEKWKKLKGVDKWETTKGIKKQQNKKQNKPNKKPTQAA